jgi:WhiB family transcriptional regulator, redox-sensing transcriptional regulator
MTVTLTNGTLTISEFFTPVIPDAPCAGLLDVFFPTPSLKAAERNALVNRAKAICESCPSVDVCLAGAIERRESDGVWGGELFREGEIVEAYIGPGRPRKVPVTAAAA